MASVAKHIRKLRLERSLTQEELAERLHVTRQAVSNWERSAAQPDLDTLQAIAAALGSTFQSPLAAYSFLVFVLLYVPCVAAVSTIHKEMNSTKWTIRSILWQVCAAYLGSFLVYQIGSLIVG